MTHPDDIVTCLWCRQETVPLQIAGHSECEHCHKIIDECCSGETLELQAEAE